MTDPSTALVHPVPAPEMHIGSYLGPSPLPEIDDRERAIARTHAVDGVVLYFDPNLPRDAPITADNIIGSRRVDPDGHFTGQETRNSQFQPCAATARTTFTTAFEPTLWRVVHGYESLGALVRGMAEATFHVPVAGKPGSPLHITAADGGYRTLAVYSSPDRIPALWPRWMVRQVPGRTILEDFGSDITLVIDMNGGHFPGFRLPAYKLGALWEENQQLNPEPAAAGAEKK